MPPIVDALVYFDLATTGMNNECYQVGVEIISIGATCPDHGDFSINMMPEGGIQAGATTVNKIHKENGKLWRHGQELPYVSQEEGLQAFVAYVEDIVAAHSAAGHGRRGNVFLVAHNCANFDSYILCHSLVKYGIWESIRGVRFLDTMPAFKSVFRARWNVALRRVIGYEPTHDSLEDARALRKAVESYAFVHHNDRGDAANKEAKFLKRYGRKLNSRPTVTEMMQTCQEITGPRPQPSVSSTVLELVWL